MVDKGFRLGERVKNGFSNVIESMARVFGEVGEKSLSPSKDLYVN